MRLTKDNIKYFIDVYDNLDLHRNKEITHIDYLPDNVKSIDIDNSNIEEITCKLPEGLERFYCSSSKLTKLPLLPKSLISFHSKNSNLPNEFQVNIWFNNIKCNRLRKLQLLELI